MGGTPSKAPIVEAPAFDYSKAKVDLPDVEEWEESVRRNAAAANAQLASALATAGSWQWYFYAVLWLSLAVGIAYIVYEYIYPWAWGLFNTSTAPKPLGSTGPTGLGAGIDLSIKSAIIVKKGETNKDVTQQVTDKVASNQLHILVDGSFDASEGSNMVVKYQYPGQEPGSTTVAYGKLLDIVPPSAPGSAPASSSSWWDKTNALPTAKDAKEVSTVSIAENGEGGDYSYQFWMYVTDWNYKFGQEKNIMMRTDATNSAIMNPVVSLHPTDNTMKVSVSIFPSTSGGSKAEPAPAGHSGSTDDVFVCEVPNIPLQTWLAVGVTVSTRNLDVYLNGKLVKSCFLTGVPKPVTGSVTLNADGGFSGWMCSFYHYARLMVPADAQKFFSSGVPCNVPGTNSNYKVAIGVQDTKGQVVSNYMF